MAQSPKEDMSRSQFLDLIVPGLAIARALTTKQPISKEGIINTTFLFGNVLYGCVPQNNPESNNGIEINTLDKFTLFMFVSDNSIAILPSSALTFAPNVIPIAVETGISALIAPTLATLTIPTLIADPMLVADISQGPPRVFINNHTWVDLTPQEAALVRAGGKIVPININNTTDQIDIVDQNHVKVATIRTYSAESYAKTIIDTNGFYLQPVDPNWKPPNKNYCGHNMEVYFAQMLLNETIAKFMNETIQSAADRNQAFNEFDKNKIMQNFESDI